MAYVFVHSKPRSVLLTELCVFYPLFTFNLPLRLFCCLLNWYLPFFMHIFMDITYTWIWCKQFSDCKDCGVTIVFPTGLEKQKKLFSSIHLTPSCAHSVDSTCSKVRWRLPLHKRTPNTALRIPHSVLSPALLYVLLLVLSGLTLILFDHSRWHSEGGQSHFWDLVTNDYRRTTTTVTITTGTAVTTITKTTTAKTTTPLISVFSAANWKCRRSFTAELSNFRVPSFSSATVRVILLVNKKQGWSVITRGPTPITVPSTVLSPGTLPLKTTHLDNFIYKFRKCSSNGCDVWHCYWNFFMHFPWVYIFFLLCEIWYLWVFIMVNIIIALNGDYGFIAIS